MSTSQGTARQYGRKSSAIPPIPESSLGDVTPALSPMFKPALPTSQLKPFQTSTAPPPSRSATPPSRLSLKHATRLKSTPRAPIPHPETAANLRQNTASPPSGTPRFHPTSRNHNYCNEHEKQKLPVTNTHDFLRRNAFFENFPLTFYDPV